MGSSTGRRVTFLSLFGARLRSGVAFLGVSIALGWAGAAAAQEPPPVRPRPADTARVQVDTAAVPVDTTVTPAVADTLKPVSVLPSFPQTDAPRWSAGVWEWDRSALLAAVPITLTELLERIPGITPIRSGFFGYAEAASAAGATAGRFEVILDGYALDPLAAGTHDLSRLELAQLRRVRVERRVGAVRVELETLAPVDPRSYSSVEAGTGDLATNLFRGLFLAPRFLVGPLALGIERLDSDGLGRREPANTFTGWLKWSRAFGSGKHGLQFELRRSAVERTVEDEAVGGARQDWVLRARSAPLPRLTTEAYFGASEVDDAFTETPVKEREAQGGVRALYQTDRGWARTAVRLRDNENLPLTEAELAGGLRLPASVYLSADVSWTDWRDGIEATSFGLRSELGPFHGFRPFVEYNGGRRGVPFLRDTAGTALLTERTSLRYGADFARGGFHLGAAGVKLQADSIPDFGLPFDATGRLFPGGTMRGLELVGRVPLFWKPLALEGWYTRWGGESSWIYLPEESWRAALVYHHLPLESGNLELLARLEGHHRGEMIVPGGPTTASVPALTAFDFYLQVRILDVRAFLRWDNFTHQLMLRDWPETDRFFPGQRVLYGVKWQFWN